MRTGLLSADTLCKRLSPWDMKSRGWGQYPIETMAFMGLSLKVLSPGSPSESPARILLYRNVSSLEAGLLKRSVTSQRPSLSEMIVRVKGVPDWRGPPCGDYLPVGICFSEGITAGRELSA